MNHLAIIRAEYIQKIASGQKTVESRLSVNRPACWNVKPGDMIYFKVSGGDIALRASVFQIDRYEQLKIEDIAALAELYAQSVQCAPDTNYWKIKSVAKYAVFIHLANAQPFRVKKCDLPISFGNAWLNDFELPELVSAAIQSSFDFREN